MSKKIPVYEAKVLDADNTGIFAMSFVEIPAIEVNFVALKRTAPVKMHVNKMRQVLTGPVLIPDQLIYRYDTQLGEYYLKYTAADIERISQKMMRTGLALSSTTHQHEKALKGNYCTELWLVEDPKRDKSVALGLGELPKGTLCASYKVSNAYYWQTEVLSGNVKGFSIEGIFNFNNVNMSKQKAKVAAKAAAPKSGKVTTFLKQLAAFLEGETAADADALVDEAKKDEVGAGDPYLIFELAAGGEVMVDAEGFATLDGEQMAAGEHELADGNFIVIDDNGELVITQPEADGADQVEAKQKAAKERAAAFLKAQGDPKTAEITKLKKRLAELEKEPSTGKAKAKTDEAAAAGKKPEDMTFTEKMAAVVKNRRERATKKKAE